MKRILALLMLLALPAQAKTTPEIQAQKYVALHLRAEAALGDFDRELETNAEPGLLERSLAYRDLIALRHLLEGIEKNLAAGKGSKWRMETLFSRFKRANSAELPALHDLVTNSKAFGNRVLFATNEALLAFRETHRAEIEARVEKARKSDHLEGEIRAMIRDLGLDEESLAPADIHPSPGKEGNITGNSFPAQTWALTYDDGPSSKNTLPILNNLQNFGKKATFFWLAENLAVNSDIVDTVKAAGMPLANHSYTHANLPKVSAAKLRHEVVESTSMDERYYGFKPQFFRCPYGAGLNIARIRQLIAENGMIHVFWNVDSLDWKDKNPSSVFARVKKQMESEKKGVILFHDIHAQTLEASRLLLEYSRGFDGKPQALRWVTLPEIVKELNGGQ